MNPNVAHIVYASDNRFAEILGVSLVSLYENSKDMDDIVVYILDSGIADDNRQKLISVCKSYKRSDLVFIKAKNISEKLSMDVAVDRGSLSQYARFFVSSDLPKGLSRVLYLDCDTIILKSIKELWNLTLHGKTIAALMDAFSKYYRVNIDLKENDIMFNSGVMLIDLNKWKEQGIEKKLLKFIIAKNGRIQQGDQGALNHVLSCNTYCFEPRFNSVTIFYDFNYQEMMIYRKPPRFYTKEQIQEAVENPSIIHFTTSFLSRRPWVEGCKHRYVNVWLKFKEMSPWVSETLWKDNTGSGKRTMVRILKIFPRKIMISICGFVQAYGRPWKNLMSSSQKERQKRNDRSYKQLEE
ncbi:MAG: glycosyltransferase family 8 protein [Eubacterium sp.]|nr:glycosyltransferase family 8 protein [Eubacterium sp.]